MSGAGANCQPSVLHYSPAQHRSPGAPRTAPGQTTLNHQPPLLFLVDTKQRTATPATAATLGDLSLTERYDLQEWVLAQPSLLGEDLLVVTSEFNQFDRTAERLDVLMLDRTGKLVVVELKRSAVGTAAELQGLRYAAYCSALSFDDVVEMYAAFHASRDKRELSREEARAEILDFIAAPDFEELDDKPRIILAAEEFPPEITATLLWLRTFEVEISAVRLRLRLYQVGEQLTLDSSMLIPLPEAEEYLIRRERKDHDQASRSRGINEQYRLFFQDLMDRLREDHQFTNARIGQPQNWYSFASGFGGISYAPVFSRKGLRTELYIDTASQEKNKGIFDALHRSAEDIQKEFDRPLTWQRLDNRKASRIAIHHDATIAAPEEELIAAREWAIAMLLRLKEVFGPRLERLV